MAPRYIVVAAAVSIMTLRCGLSFEGVPMGASSPDASDDGETSDGIDAGVVDVVSPDVRNEDAADAADAAVDARTACAAICPTPGRCNSDGTCAFTCSGSGCSDPITCPPGIPCSIHCGATGIDQACKEKVSCGDASTCIIKCMATGLGAACGDVDCGNARKCEVICNKTGLGGACQRDIQCPRGSGAQCNVTCGGNGEGCGDIRCCNGNTCTAPESEPVNVVACP